MLCARPDGKMFELPGKTARAEALELEWIWPGTVSEFDVKGFSFFLSCCCGYAVGCDYGV